MTGDSLFMVEEEPAQQLGFREHIVGVLTAMICALVIMSILHYMWLSFGNSLYSRVITNTYGQPEILGGITSTEDGDSGQWRVRTLFRRRYRPRISEETGRVQGVGCAAKTLN